ncbi:MAG: hypothetical protein OXF54_06000 [Caldilineaceae bacterium]|nr:hypothetical protein [Caldilineaceae bacterium]
MSQEYTDPYSLKRTVLVAVVNNQADLRRAASEGWYRIPQRRAPRRVGADYLAFYQTGAFGSEAEARTVSYYAAIRRYQLLSRAELLPDEADHARAEEYYFRIEIGPLMRLAQPVPATTFRRLTFIHTTLERLLNAKDVTELKLEGEPFQTLWSALRASRLRPLPNRLAGEWPVDIALRVRNGYLGIRLDEASDMREAQEPADRWTILRIPESQIAADLESCLRAVGSALVDLGGSLDAKAGREIVL